jgi:hypothetical protein
VKRDAPPPTQTVYRIFDNSIGDFWNKKLALEKQVICLATRRARGVPEACQAYVRGHFTHRLRDPGSSAGRRADDFWRGVDPAPGARKNSRGTQACEAHRPARTTAAGCAGERTRLRERRWSRKNKPKGRFGLTHSDASLTLPCLWPKGMFGTCFANQANRQKPTSSGPGGDRKRVSAF